VLEVLGEEDVRHPPASELLLDDVSAREG